MRKEQLILMADGIEKEAKDIHPCRGRCDGRR